MTTQPGLGDKVRDKVTGFTGIVTGRVEYLTGCQQCRVQPPVKGEGDWVEAQWFDETRLEVIEREAIKVIDDRPDTRLGADALPPRST